MEGQHYNQPKRRDAKFIKPPNYLKAKVGSGGLDEKTLDRAQTILENNAADFIPMAQTYLDQMMQGITAAKENKSNPNSDKESLIAGILFPCVQLKANGSMFHYKIVTRIAEKFVQFMEVIDTIDNDIIDLSLGFHKTINAVVNKKTSEYPAHYEDGLVEELGKACARYFEKYKITKN